MPSCELTRASYCERCGYVYATDAEHQCPPPRTPEGQGWPDNVNHPQHYTNSDARCSACNHPIECIDVTRHLDFNIGNAIKYLWRYKNKNGKEDLQKAIWYINDEIKKL